MDGITTTLSFIFWLLLLVMTGFGLNLFYLTGVSLHSSFRKRQASAGSLELPQKNPPSSFHIPGTWPRVLIQLPIYNEPHVIERLLDAVSLIRYPSPILEIQILDDSTDGTSELIRSHLERRGETGKFEFHRRGSRAGFKAGALAHGLARSKADFIAILDADFSPRPDFLEQLLPELMAHPEIGFIQARWGFINRNHSLLTRLIAITLSLHFSIEQHARSEGGFILNFNGTAGILRRSAIDAAGGWEGDTLTEDMDLSYRMACAGFLGKYRADYSVPCEIPSTFHAFRLQQKRWTQGALQTALKLYPRILASQRLSWAQKAQAGLHLFHGLVYPIAFAIHWIALPLVLRGTFHLHWNQLFICILVLNFCTRLCYMVADFANPDERPTLVSFFLISWVSWLGIAIAASNTWAVFDAIRGKRSTFVRTPKLGDSTSLPASEETRPDAYAWASALPAILCLGVALQMLTGFKSWLAVSFFTLTVGYALPIWISVTTTGRIRKPAPSSSVG